MVQPVVSTSTISAAAPLLNVYKKVPVIRIPSDSLTYEDAEGNQKSVSVQELGDAIATAVSSLVCRFRGLVVLEWISGAYFMLLVY